MRSQKRKHRSSLDEILVGGECSSLASQGSIMPLPPSAIHSSSSKVTARQSSVRATLLTRSEQHFPTILSTFTYPVSSSTESMELHNSINCDFSNDYDDLGDCNCVCEFCGATFWFCERLKAFPLSKRPRLQMEIKGEIQHLQPLGKAIPIEARFIRGWRPYRTGNSYCHLIVDKRGDAIQVFSEDDNNYSIRTSIKIMDCYRLENYVCSRSPAQMKVVPHSASLRVGKASSIVLIDNTSQIPSTYFNFMNYENLDSRINNHQILSGRVKNAWNEKTDYGGTLTRLNIDNPSGQEIEITLWPEIARFINTDSLFKANGHIIAAITSLRVTTYRGKMQLGSTAATHVYIDPDIDIAKSITNTFERLEGPKQLPGESIKMIETIESPSQRNRITIAALHQRIPNEIASTTFTCRASITAFNSNRAWYYTACKECHRKIEAQTEGYVCVNHGIIEPKYW
ncbi:hypothetical protein E3N88_28305 [Mikania micrantha]|uniref:Replication protein A OB domain-containing protein n=1 Tax=Mikania micrantha TaxID=192012 RepID=A0A5N6N0P8_9ASTR|nr:hypothetical protein E3N88_28305 [Mikania micrantha]